MRVRGARTAVVLEAVDACEGDLQGRWVQPDFEMSFGKHHRAFGRQQRRACLRCGDGGSEHDTHNIGEMSWRAMPDGAWRAVLAPVVAVLGGMKGGHTPERRWLWCRW